MTRCWKDLRQELEHIAFTKGVTNTAHMIPASRGAVYNLINGTAQKPTKAMKACIERLVERQRSSRTEQSEDTQG
jgi:chemotaxis regulatin CheY-phosphate phosphatase CheZ